MTLKLTRLADGSMSVDGDGAAAYVDALLAGEEHDLGLSSWDAPSTDRERRTKLAALRSVVDVPREEAWRIFLRAGREGFTDDQRKLFLRNERVEPNDTRAQAVGTDSAGGFLTPASFAAQFTVSLKQHDELFEAATLVETDRGTACNFPVDDDSSVSTIVAENAQSLTTSPVVFDQVAFGRCPMWRSGHIISSIELAQDSAFPLEAMLAQNFGRRFARGLGAAFITQLLTDATVGVTSASPTAVTGDEILDLIASVDAAYTLGGSFLMSTATLIVLRKLKGSTSGDYLLPFGRDGAGRKTLFDFPIYESPSMPSIASTAKAIAFGDVSRFIRRQVRNSLLVKTYTERYADRGQVAYEGFLRVDGKLAKSANMPVPIRVLACHS
jgi:HK97 family phage major capsid protein